MSQNSDGTWHLEPGDRLSAYYVKGWLRYPGFSIVGRSSDGQITPAGQKILDCYNLNGGFDSVGWPIDDGGGVFVHNWQPWDYACQNFRNAKGEESCIIAGASGSPSAYRVKGLIWEFYRFGQNGRFGPDIRLADGLTALGAPIGPESAWLQPFENGFLVAGLSGAFSYGKSAAGDSAVAVSLCEKDGTVVATGYPGGELCSLTLLGERMSDSHNALAWVGGPACDYYAVMVDGLNVMNTTARQYVEANIPSGAARQYKVVAMSHDQGSLEYSNTVSIIMPGQVPSFVLTAESYGHSACFLSWENTAFHTSCYTLFRDGVQIAYVYGSAYADFYCRPQTTYEYRLAATSPDHFILGYSNYSTATTDPALPPPAQSEPYADKISLFLDQTVLLCPSSGQATAVILDQYGRQMTGQEVWYFSSDPRVLFISTLNGEMIAENVGSAEVWAHVYSRGNLLLSERIRVEVVAESAAPPPYLNLQAGWIGYDSYTLKWDPCPFPQAAYFEVYENNLFLDAVWECNYRSAETYRPGDSLSVFVLALDEFGQTIQSSDILTFNLYEHLDMVLIDPPEEVVFGREYDITIGISNATGHYVGNLSAHLYPFCQGEFIFLNEEDPDICFFSYPEQIPPKTLQPVKTVRIKVIKRKCSSKFELSFQGQGDIYNYGLNQGKGLYLPGRLPLAAYINLRLSGGVSQAVYDFNQPARAELKVENLGLADSPPCLLEFYLNGSLVAGLDVKALAPEESQSLILGPALLPSGAYDYRAVLDPAGLIIESQKDDNVVQGGFQVLYPPRPDLVVSLFAMDAQQYYDSQPVTVLAEVKNQGQAQAPISEFLIYTPDGNEVHWQEIPALSPGQDHAFSLTSPFALPAGFYEFGAAVDPNGQIDEASEENNTSSLSFTVIPSPEIGQSDLLVAGLSYFKIRFFSVIGVFIVLVKNQGDAPAKNFSLDLEIPQLNKAFAAEINYLAPNAYAWRFFTLKSPPNGLYTLRAEVDAPDEISEQDEKNNVLQVERTL